MELHQPAPDFELPDLAGRAHRLSDYRGRIVIVNFWSCECPHSERVDLAILESLKKWRGDVELLAVASNRNESIQSVDQVSKARGIPTVLIDADHVVADRYEAVATPHVFVVDWDGVLRYRGAADDATLRNGGASRFFLNEAVDSLIKGRLPALTETPAFGCAIVREI